MSTFQISAKLFCQMGSWAYCSFILNFLCKYPYQYFCDKNMYSPPKKKCLACQFVMEVSRKEGLRWEADLAAHVSKVFLIYTTFLNPLLHYVFWGKLQGSKALRRISLVDGHFFHIRSPWCILSPCPLQNLSQGSHIWRPYKNYEGGRRTLCLTR